MARRGAANGNGKRLASQQSVNAVVKSICDIMRRSNCAGALQYVPFVQTKRKLLDDCDLWCIVSLPAGAFVNAGAGVKTNLRFFTRGGPTECTWYYDLPDAGQRRASARNGSKVRI